MFFVLYIVAAAVLVSTLAPVAVTIARPAIAARKHDRCLDRIAVLERDCGIEVTEPWRLPVATSISASQAAANWTAIAKRDVRLERNEAEHAYWKAQMKEMKRRERAERDHGRYRRRA